jgi:hypothetical protein
MVPRARDSRLMAVQRALLALTAITLLLMAG